MCYTDIDEGSISWFDRKNVFSFALKENEKQDIL